MAKVKSLASKKAHIQAPMMMNSAKGVSPQSTPESQEGPQNIAHKPRAAAPMEIVANKDVPSWSIILRYMVVPRYLISRNATRVRIKQGLLRHHDPGPLWAANTPPHRWGNLARHANVIRFSGGLPVLCAGVGRGGCPRPYPACPPRRVRPPPARARWGAPERIKSEPDDICDSICGAGKTVPGR